MDDATFKARIAQIFDDLPHYSYYDLLNLQSQAKREEIRQSFHKMALSMHPDRYQSHQDQELRQQIYAIYKRICEGYQVLSNIESRREYDARLATGEKRLVKKERKTSGPKRMEAGIKNPQAKKFFMMGQDAERRGDLKNAQINYKFALDLEAHPTIEQKLSALRSDSESSPQK